MNTTNGQTHLEEGDLVRLLGDELSTHERAAAEAHLGSCDACAARLSRCGADLEEATRLLNALPVAAVDPARRARSLEAVRGAVTRHAGHVAPAAPVTRTRFDRGRRFIPSTALARAAAVAGLLVAGGVAASPAGAWIVDRVRDLIQPAQPVTVAEPEPSTLPAHSSVVAFTPVGTELVLEFNSAQEHGELVLRIDAAPGASATVTGGEGDLDVVVLPGALRIRNDYDMAARYEVVVPAHLERLRVRVGDAEEMVLNPRDLGAGWSAVVGLRHGSIDSQDDGL